ncbi:M56 family metallopeptidase [Flavobacterium sp. SM15]|uniref:energy transducer TonB n=1 Tax=Flavobacterium sp. SM15 TaxID=2908005 RepID=UPI001ED9C88F|nr:energy transducer TonB [Flavobacterium sp. SM15]MCG2610041.1 M56 family metallopeptidase [Flavobacterium sp. SM15]
MILYLIKSGLCLMLLFGVYHFFLGRERMYRFNRFYLLISLFFGLLIPLNTIETKAISVVQEAPQAIEPIIPQQFTTAPQTTSYLSPENIILAFYLAITLVLLIRFTNNLASMFLKIYHGKKVSHNDCTLVLTEEKSLPFTFLNYIFINQDDYLHNNIEPELWEHEKAHVQQHHSFDIIFIELLQVFFWFQPALYAYKNALQFNHEFLADQAVLQNSVPTQSYQNLILAKITDKKPLPFSSNLAYLVTKKRFIMMTKQTSTLKSALLKLAVLPLIAGLTASFSAYEEIEITPAVPSLSKPILAPDSVKENSKNQEVTDAEYFAGVRFNVYEKFNGFKGVNLKWSKTYEEFTPEDFQKHGKWLKIWRQKPLEKKSPTAKELTDFKNSKKYAIWIDGVNVSNNKLNQYNPTDFAHFSGSVILKNARTKKHPQPFQYWFYTHNYYNEKKMGEALKKYPGNTIDMCIERKSEVQDKATTAVPVQETKNPEFPGGITEFMKYFATNFKYPENLKTTESLRLVASYNVTKDGTINDIKILKGHSPEVDQEIIRVLKASPKWIPGEKDGKKVDAQMTLPIQVQAK